LAQVNEIGSRELAVSRAQLKTGSNGQGGLFLAPNLELCSLSGTRRNGQTSDA